AVGAVEGRQAVQLCRELSRISQVESRVLGENVKGFSLTREGTAQHWLMDEVNAEFGSVPADRAAHIVAELVFLLVANDGERGNRGDELVVAVGFEAGDGLGGGAERKCQRKAEVPITCRGAMQVTDARSEVAHPRRAEGKGIADDAILIIGVRRSAGGRQGRLLYQGVGGGGVVEGVTDEPLRTL